MDEQYIMALLQLLMQGEGGGLQGSYGGLYGEGHPTSPTGQYRTHKTPYISDGNVPLSKALPNQNKFSPDALFDADPALKQVLGQLVYETGHDPYGVYAEAGQPRYQLALLQQALRDGGFEPINEADYVKTDSRGQQSYPNIEDVLSDIEARDETQQIDYEMPDIISGKYKGMAKRTKDVKSSDVVRERVRGYQDALDDFITQAAPSMERNTNNIDYAWTRVGGMPFPGINSGALDYEGTGPAFPTATQSLGRGRSSGGGRQAAPAAKPQGSWKSRLRSTAKPKPKGKK